MPTINELSAVDTPSGSDLLPIYSQQNGDARKLSLANLSTWLNEQTNSAANNPIINVQEKGIFPGSQYAISNCDAWAALVSTIAQQGGYANIIWPASNTPYYFSPKDHATYGLVANAWRQACELVDVKYVYHDMTGASIFIVNDATKYRGNPATATTDESPIQFRATYSGSCFRVGGTNITVSCTRTLADPTNGHSDGSSFGVAFRGCQLTTLINPTCINFGTDGIYYGTGYSNTPQGSRHVLINPNCDANYRQGISVVSNSDGIIIGGSITNTAGGSFQNGIDFEPESGSTQNNWIVSGLKTSGNVRAGANFIRTSSVKFVNCDIDEETGTPVGAISLDGDGVYDITFSGGSYKSVAPVLYVSGSAAALNPIDEIHFTDGAKLSCVGNTPASSAFLRVNPSSNTGMKIGRFSIDGCEINGNGGINFISDGTNQARLDIRNTKWYLTNPAGSALAFVINAPNYTTSLNLDNVEMSVDGTKTLATYAPYIVKGSMKNCTLSSWSGAQLNWQDYGAGRTQFIIGFNNFSTYSYYKGVVSALNITTPGTVETSIAGDYGLSGRVVHGGRQRLVQYAASPGSFIDRQAPLDGDVCRNVANSGPSIAPTEYTYTSAAGWKQSGFICYSGATAARPTPVAALQTAEIGIEYYDTTTVSFVRWNGASWV